MNFFCNKKSKKSREEMQQEMELQLHEQYAQNNNANLTGIITLIVTLLAVFYGYGYVYLYSTLEFSDCFQELHKDGHYTLDALIFAAMAVYVVLGIIYYICYSQGLHQRLEQFITFAIRTKYYRRFPKVKVSKEEFENFPELLMEESYKEIFPSGYHPFKGCEIKFPKDSELAQGLFGNLLTVIKYVAVLLTLSWVIKLVAYAAHIGLFRSLKCCAGVVSILFLLIVCILVYFALNGQRKKLQDKYLGRINYYVDKLTQENE